MSERRDDQLTFSPQPVGKRRDNLARQKNILEKLLNDGATTIEVLAEQFSVSRMTIHRDAQALAQQGLIDRLHGSLALRDQTVVENTVGFRRLRAADLKQTIITKAVSLIRPGEVIILDDSTTVAQMLPSLPALAPLTIITNAMSVIQALAPYPEIRLICLGGDYSASRNAFFGLVCEQAVHSLRAQTMFLSTSIIHNGIALQNDQNVVKAKQAMMGISDRAVLLADSTKFRSGGLHRLEALSRFDHVLTDTSLKPALRKTLLASGVRLEICD